MSTWKELQRQASRKGRSDYRLVVSLQCAETNVTCVSMTVDENKCKQQPHWASTTHPREWLHQRRLATLGADEDVERRELGLRWCGDCKMVQLLWKMIWQFFTNIFLPYNPVILLLGPKRKEKLPSKTCMWTFIAAVFITAQTWRRLWYHQAEQRNRALPLQSNQLQTCAATRASLWKQEYILYASFVYEILGSTSL